MNKYFVMMVGISGSGKSYFAQQIAEGQKWAMFPEAPPANWALLSSDLLREEINGDAADQRNHPAIFKEMEKRAVTLAKSDTSIIYDATNLSYKSRRSVLSLMESFKDYRKIAMVMVTPIEVALEQNGKRDRQVPDFVIKRQVSRFCMPHNFEGFDDVFIEYSAKTTLLPIDYVMNKMKDFNQENPNHSLDLYEHSQRCGDTLKEQGEKNSLHLAGYLHDYGKLYTQTFVNKRGETTPVAHYYDHQNVSAYLMLFVKEVVFSNPVFLSAVVSWHMQPYFMKEPKTFEKYRKVWGTDFYNSIMKLYEADKAAH